MIPPASHPPRPSPVWLAPLALLAIGGVVYAGSLSGAFIFDDYFVNLLLHLPLQRSCGWCIR